MQQQNWACVKKGHSSRSLQQHCFRLIIQDELENKGWRPRTSLSPLESPFVPCPWLVGRKGISDETGIYQTPAYRFAQHQNSSAYTRTSAVAKYKTNKIIHKTETIENSQKFWNLPIFLQQIKKVLPKFPNAFWSAIPSAFLLNLLLENINSLTRNKMGLWPRQTWHLRSFLIDFLYTREEW